ncbi:MAG: S-layer homology domain-containing protein [Clostridia bacterium]|nr:S-layer homology domain-containing protein [Clostridia bacterium]
MKNLRRSVLWLAVAGAMTLSAAVPVRAIFRKEEAPCAVAAFAKSDGEGQLITFTKEDFTDRVTGEESLSAIVMGDLPSGGVLRLAGADVRSGEAVEVSRLGALCFVPDIGREVHTSFSFLPVFSRTGAGEEAVTVHLNISDTPNASPIAVEQSWETYADLPLWGTLKAVDPEGDGCTFTVADQGKRGTVTIEGDRFCYTPQGKSGKDSFSVVATDSFGNRSQAARITVTVTKRHDKECFTYTDMGESPAHFAALRLREAGVFAGEAFGDEAFFEPDETLTRAQFLAMAAVVADMAMPTAAVSTGLSDNDAIPAWAQGYVAAGILSGVVEGSDDGGGNRAFRAASAVTRAEAAAIADRCLSLADDGREMAFADGETVPAWARQSVVNCAARGFLEAEDNTVRAGEALTREEAAVMLYGMLKHGED